jgi:cyclin L
MFLITNDEECKSTPSRNDGISEQIEFTNRLYACEFIRTCAIGLRLNQSTCASAQVLLHRFYAKKSMKRFDTKRMAATAIWLASKLEESPRKIRDIINVLLRVEGRLDAGDEMRTKTKTKTTTVVDVYSDQFEDIKEDLVRKERHMLKEFGFVIKIEHPHKFVLNYLQILDLAGNKELTQLSLNHTNDTFYTTICIRFNAETIACASIYLAARKMSVALPENPQWWLLFDAALEDIVCICDSLLILYEIMEDTVPAYEFLGSHEMNNNSIADLKRKRV